MDLKNTYLGISKSIIQKKKDLDLFYVNDFIQSNKKEILKLLKNEEVFVTTTKTTNFLIKIKDKYFLIIYLELLSLHLSTNNDLKYRLALTFYEIKMLEQALYHIKRIPNEELSLDYLKLLSNIYHEKLEFDKCIETIRKIEKINNKNPTNSIIIINCYRRLKKIKDAEREFTNLQSTNISEYQKILIKIQIYLAKGEFYEAIKILENNEAKYKNKQEFLELYSTALRKIGSLKKSIDKIEISKSLGNKNYASIVYSLRLAENSYNLGFKDLISASKRELFEDFLNSKSIKRWQGENLNDSKLIVYPGKGIALGDKIFFFRYIIFLKNNYSNIKIYYFIDNMNQRHLFETKGIYLEQSQNIKNYSFEPKKTFFSSIANIAFIYKTMINNVIPNHVNFLPSYKERENKWSTWLSNINSNFKIGFNWKGDIKFTHDIYRSMDIRKFEPIIQIKNKSFFTLNPDITEDEKKFCSEHENVYILDNKILSDEKNNSFIDTIEVMKQMDLIITTDTSTAHLAAALQVRVFIILEYSPFWYWYTNDSNNYYQNKNLKFYKQPKPGDWDKVIEKLKEDLSRDILNDY